MANYKVWSVRRRHEWLATPLRKKRIKRRAAKRIGLWDVWLRKGLVSEDGEAEAAAQNTSGD